MPSSTREALREAVPSNWCDPLLTGPNKALHGEPGTWGCQDIERLLNAIRERISQHGADIEATLMDADRYRSLRANAAPDLLNTLVSEWDFFGDAGKQLDEIIDAAIASAGADGEGALNAVSGSHEVSEQAIDRAIAAANSVPPQDDWERKRMRAALLAAKQ